MAQFEIGEKRAILNDINQKEISEGQKLKQQKDKKEKEKRRESKGVNMK